MDDRELRRRAIALHDRFTHDGRDRRAFMADMTRLAGSVAAAQALVAAIAPSSAAAAIVPADDARILAETVSWFGVGNRRLAGYAVRPRDETGRTPAVLVIHENRGLNDHIRDVARRLAVDGFRALAPDLLAPEGGTPDDPDRAREMIGALDLARTTQDAQSGLAWLARQDGGTGRAGAVGFCWGGAMIYRLAIAAGDAMAAGVSYYGPAPDVAEAPQVRSPLMIHLAGEDARVNATAEPFAEALAAAGRDVTPYRYPDVQHAFNNDSSAERYDEAAAASAWSRTTAFLRRHLAAGDGA